jgi:ADP-ribose pyrophosphatase YjhB (NUDIX family)
MVLQAAAAAILDDGGRVLLVKENYDRRRYAFPGGAVEPGETPLDAVVREKNEETGLAVSVEHLVGLYQLHHALPDALAQARGVVRVGLPRLN